MFYINSKCNVVIANHFDGNKWFIILYYCKRLHNILLLNFSKIHWKQYTGIQQLFNFDSAIFFKLCKSQNQWYIIGKLKIAWDIVRKMIFWWDIFSQFRLIFIYIIYAVIHVKLNNDKILDILLRKIMILIHHKS